MTSVSLLAGRTVEDVLLLLRLDITVYVIVVLQRFSTWKFVTNITFGEDALLDRTAPLGACLFSACSVYWLTLTSPKCQRI